MRAGKKERNKWATRLCGEKEMGQRKRIGPWSVLTFEKFFYISRFRLKFEFDSNSNKFYMNPNSKRSINSKENASGMKMQRPII
jgi:hypothetical protein